MPYHYSSNTSQGQVALSTTNAQGQVAPPGYHYMPDGTLMSDADHARLHGTSSANVISNFSLDLSDLPAAVSSRDFMIRGTNGAVFSLEIKNGNNYYYNFTTNTFQATKARLDKYTMTSGFYKGSITFPAVTDDDQYDIYLFAEPGTQHAEYNEVRFTDGSLDINSSTGSNSLLMQKVIYQYTDITLTISTFSPTNAIGGSALSNDTLTISRGRSSAKIPFSISKTSSSGESYRITKQPTSNDILSIVSRNVGAEPIVLPGENEHPTSRTAFTGDDVNGAVTSGSVVRMDNTDLSAVIEVGDKITTAVTTDTVNGAVSNSTSVRMDFIDCAQIMAVGDRVTGNAQLDARLFTVATIGTGGSSNRFTLSAPATIDDGITLTFSSQINRDLTRVTVVETSGTATDFTMSQAVQLRDNAPLTFWPRKNYQWTLNDVRNIEEGMIVLAATNVTTNTRVGKYRDTVTLFENTEDERVIIKNEAPAIDTKGLKPTIVKGLVAGQSGNIVFDKQQVYAFRSNSYNIGGYGESQILKVHGYELKFTDLAIALTPVTTTTTAASFDSTSVVVAARDGIMNSVSTVSGIGVDPSAVPTVSSGANASGAGTIVLSTAQTLENGITLAFSDAGKIATITGNIEVIKAGTGDATIYFDIEKLIATS